MDAVKLLTGDHRSFGALFHRFRAAGSARLREDLARRLLHEARLHIALEEKYVYPIARERSGATLDEHCDVKVSLVRLEGMDVGALQFDEQLKTFVDQLLAHSNEEERLFFPALRRTMRRGELEALGRLIQNAREARPEHFTGEGLMGRALSHVMAGWRGQVRSVFERVCSAALGSNGISARTTQL